MCGICFLLRVYSFTGACIPFPVYSVCLSFLFIGLERWYVYRCGDYLIFIIDCCAIFIVRPLINLSSLSSDLFRQDLFGRTGSSTACSVTIGSLRLPSVVDCTLHVPRCLPGTSQFLWSPPSRFSFQLGYTYCYAPSHTKF